MGETNKKEVVIKKVVKEFVEAHGGDENTLEELVQYIIEKVGRTPEYEKFWKHDENKITYFRVDEYCSFFDDGDVHRSEEYWSMSFIPGDDHEADNEKLLDRSTFKKGTRDSFVVKDPFGLKGLFEISFYESTGVR